jgi:hypothetical protein
MKVHTAELAATVTTYAVNAGYGPYLNHTTLAPYLDAEGIRHTQYDSIVAFTSKLSFPNYALALSSGGRGQGLTSTGRGGFTWAQVEEVMSSTEEPGGFIEHEVVHGMITFYHDFAPAGTNGYTFGNLDNPGAYHRIGGAEYAGGDHPAILGDVLTFRMIRDSDDQTVGFSDAAYAYGTPKRSL